MVLKTQLCRFSGLKVYPGTGTVYVRVDGSQHLLLNGKVKSFFLKKKKPQKIAWTAYSRKAHKKDKASLVVRKKKLSKKLIKQPKTFAEEIKKRKLENRAAATIASRDVALKEIKDRMKKKEGGGGKKETMGGPKSKPVDKIKGGQKPSGPMGKASKGIR